MAEVKNNEVVSKKSLFEEIINQPYKVPFVNIYENEDNYYMVADLPGVSKENLELKLEDNNLTIVGKVDLKEESERNYILKEKHSGNYLRRFKISESIETEKIDAKLTDGQLEVVLPKKESVKPRNIEIV